MLFLCMVNLLKLIVRVLLFFIKFVKIIINVKERLVDFDFCFVFYVCKIVKIKFRVGSVGKLFDVNVYMKFKGKRWIENEDRF